MGVHCELLEQRKLLSFTTFDVPAAANASGVSAQFYAPRIIAGQDGSIWVSDPVQSRIARINADGTIKSFDLPLSSAPTAMAAAPDGSLWYGDVGKNEIGEITPSGAIKEFRIPKSGRYSYTPLAMTVGPDGNVWFTASYKQFANLYGFGDGGYVADHPIVARITPAGRVREVQLHPERDNPPQSIVSFGRYLYVVWLGQLVRVNPSGHLTTFRGDSITFFDAALLVRPDGQLGGPGFTITLHGRSDKFTYNAIFDPKVPTEIHQGTNGPDGNIWFVNWDSIYNLPQQIGFVRPDGTITLLAAPGDDKVTDIVTGGDGNLWMVNADMTKVYRLTLDSATLSADVT